mmetsp:Transcript_14790/g.37360  ORF Transcript_14790/g.37360 Transcript_14790/m.37360 type:complete len:286 (+) Transcript_14790:839-1696(+)
MVGTPRALQSRHRPSDALQTTHVPTLLVHIVVRALDQRLETPGLLQNVFAILLQFLRKRESLGDLFVFRRVPNPILFQPKDKASCGFLQIRAKVVPGIVSNNILHRAVWLESDARPHSLVPVVSHTLRVSSHTDGRCTSVRTLADDAVHEFWTWSNGLPLVCKRPDVRQEVQCELRARNVTNVRILSNRKALWNHLHKLGQRHTNVRAEHNTIDVVLPRRGLQVLDDRVHVVGTELLQTDPHRAARMVLPTALPGGGRSLDVQSSPITSGHEDRIQLLHVLEQLV